MQIARLTESEELIMKVMWELPEESSSLEILDVITKTQQRDWKIQTVCTFLRNLVDKKYVKVIQKGKGYTYKILISKSTYKRTLYKHLICRWYNMDITALCLEMIENGDLPKEILFSLH